jgi:hypothetical protein
MDEKAVRFWGVIVGGGCIAAALAVATLTGPREPPAPAAAPTVSGAPSAPASAPTAVDPSPVYDGKAPPASAAPAQAGSDGAVTFIVRFASGHPLARAQDLEAQGRHAEAVQAANAGLRARRELRGLCYDRFTLGGAEVVLKLCAPVAAGERAEAQRRWSVRLAAMRGVEYAEPNVILQPEKQR